MKVNSEKGSDYTLYEFSETEFKSLLGIDAPGSVLNVQPTYPLVGGKKLTVRVVGGRAGETGTS